MHKSADSKKEVVRIICILLAVVAVALLCASPFIASAVESESSKRVVVVDAGHGGDDGGVRGVHTGVKESEINLKVARLLGEYLVAGGFKVVYTRTSDTMHRYKGVTDNKKRADMFKRGEIINSAKPEAVVSVHMNYYTSGTRRGAQVFYAKNSEQSELFADTMQELLNRDINLKNGGREYSALTAEKYLLTCSPYPTVIAECGFLSNPIDEANLMQSDYQAMLAQVLYQAVVIFLS